MDLGSKKVGIEKVEVPFHEHPLIPFTRFTIGRCQVCSDIHGDEDYYMYGGYRCNESGCETFVFHKECINLSPELNHSTHPDHSLKLTTGPFYFQKPVCRLCRETFEVGYCCSRCDFKLDLKCAMTPQPFVLPQNSYGHEHLLKLSTKKHADNEICKVCNEDFKRFVSRYRCPPCKFFIHVDCLDFPEAYHTSHPQHQLKSMKDEVPDYADKTCLLCDEEFDAHQHQLHHCELCNFSICRACMKNPPPVDVECSKTHEHPLRLVPRLIEFTCNVCGELGDRSPYFCRQCNFMIHRQCIDLPRVININRHDHRISYTPRLGNGEWKCRVCPEKVNGLYGGYTCEKCPGFAVHSLCATREDVWDTRELEGIPEEKEIPPFQVIDANTINHFSHDHNLRINKNGHGQENKVCEACLLQILSEPFYSCEECDFILHGKCANLPRKKRHMSDNLPYTLLTDSRHKITDCNFCFQLFSGFRYSSGHYTIDLRCAEIPDTLVHESHQQHPLNYMFTDLGFVCSQCQEEKKYRFLKCYKCEYVLDGKCAVLPEKVMKIRYDDHPLALYFGDKDHVDGEYWCEACETKVNPKGWFYTCNDCNTILHISCVVGDFSYMMPGSYIVQVPGSEVVSNTSICRSICYVCNSRCKLPTILKLSADGVDVYLCSWRCMMMT